MDKSISASKNLGVTRPKTEGPNKGGLGGFTWILLQFP